MTFEHDRRVDESSLDHGLLGEDASDASGAPACLVAPGSSQSCRVVTEVEVGLDPEGVVVDPRTDLAYVSCSRSNSVTIVDLRDMSLRGRLEVGREPIDIAIDVPTGRLFTADARSDQVTVIETLSAGEAGPGRVVGTVPVGSYPAGLAVDEQARRLYCGDTMGSTMSVVDVDSLERVAVVPAELGAGAIAVDSVMKRAYCVNFVTGTVTVVETEGLTVMSTVRVGEGPCAVVVDQRTRDVFVINSLASTVVRIDASSLDPVAEFPVPNAPVGLTASPLGDRIYTGNRGDGSMSVFGLDGTEWERVPVGTAPGGVAVHPTNPRRVLVANAGTGSLSLIEDLLEGPSESSRRKMSHPLVGARLPDFALPDLHSGKVRHQSEWAEKKYILNFFASW